MGERAVPLGRFGPVFCSGWETVSMVPFAGGGREEGRICEEGGGRIKGPIRSRGEKTSAAWAHHLYRFKLPNR